MGDTSQVQTVSYAYAQKSGRKFQHSLLWIQQAEKAGVISGTFQCSLVYWLEKAWNKHLLVGFITVVEIS